MLQRHGIELRCAYSNGRSAQCVLPPSIHPDTGKPYEWEYANPEVGDWRNPPELPRGLLEIWRDLIGSKRASPTAEEGGASSGELEGWLAGIDAKHSTASG